MAECGRRGRRVAAALLAAFTLGPGMGAGRAQTPARATMLDRSATIVLKVADYEAARRQVLDDARARGGQLLDAKTMVNEKGRKHGWVRLRMDADRLAGFLPVVGGAGKLYAENAQASDTLSEYEELARRVERLQQHEGRLSGVLQSPRRMRGSDILYLQERLFRASVDESLLSQQRLDLERSAHNSTILVDFFEPGTMPADAPGSMAALGQRFATAAGLARAGLTHEAARGATALAYVMVYAPLWLPALLVALFLLAWAWRERRRLVAWCLILATHLLRLVGIVVGWMRAAWEARHQPVGLPGPLLGPNGPQG